MAKRVKAKLGFPGHIESVEIELPPGEPAPWDADSKLAVIGKDATRHDALAKVTGKARYTTDIKRPGMLYARVLRAAHAAAEVQQIDVAKAKKLAGVKGVVVLPVRNARFVGQPLAAIAATSEDVAARALALCKVSYKTRPFVVQLDDAMKAAAPAVHAGGAGASAGAGKSANIRKSKSRRRGDVAKGLRAAKHKVEATFRTQVVLHSSLEPHGIVVDYKDGKADVWCSTQATFAVRDEIAKALEIPVARVRVHAEYVGGGFGSKFHAGTHGLLAAKLSRQTGAPVRLCLDREEEQTATGNRPDSLQRLTLGADARGQLSAMKTVSYGTGGIAGGAGTASPLYNLYDCKSKAAVEHDVYTNAGPAAPFRAPGHPQGAFALEQAIDMLAERAGVDPIAFRINNDKNPVRQAELRRGAERIGWDARRNKKAGGGAKLGAHGELRRGIGVANGLWYNTGRARGEIHVKLHHDGMVEVISGGQDIGTGARTLLAMVVAEELGLSPSAIRTHIGDTSGPYAPGSGGSTTTPTMSPAARKAGYRARLRLEALARKVLGLGDDAALVFADGKVQSKDGGKQISFKKLCARLPEQTMTFSGPRAPNYKAYRETTAGVQLAEVEVDIETGVVRVVKIVAVQDAGRLLNPLTARSQVNGAVLQGMSMALFEERVMDSQQGHVTNANLEQYKIAGAVDVPEIDVQLFDVYNGSNSTGALGLGEPPIVATPGAIANAVYNAIGARVMALPITPARVLAALAAAKKGGAR
ncbi:MAG: xanthine dehydrogenase family protein molybdopterin-binding subunit [Myxococcales bacterium]|nr:xanthine dehydrogenase family protein molybdopterin-binding subunit [Myxococcales bacterium]